MSSFEKFGWKILAKGTPWVSNRSDSRTDYISGSERVALPNLMPKRSVGRPKVSTSFFANNYYPFHLNVILVRKYIFCELWC